ncbi:TetR/AcrR family transcriptional regulator [uncultured Nocardioides sp.]|uniref:TetR/AcrR family transcriptional regulator n=1 Tax=uncultured Nocardioides sp. TaxID=198441 RepID=UPI00262ED9B9|nr:TetR/AcrR family transcriptional regulator [uncultured Nocardioides sp.]
MTTAPYHHGNLRAALVEAAVAAARESGPDGLVVRHLARRVGVSHNAAYRHFSDRDALVAEVAEVGMGELTTAMRRRTDRVPPGADPEGEVLAARARLSECGRGYVDFALAEPGLFRVLFAAYPSPPSLGTDGTKDPDDPFVVLNALLDDLVRVGHLAPEARPGAEITCWSAVHGFAVLHSEGPLRELDEATRSAALDVVLETIDRSYGATTGAGRGAAGPG